MRKTKLEQLKMFEISNAEDVVLEYAKKYALCDEAQAIVLRQIITTIL